MFPLEYQVNIHHQDGEVQRYTLVENQDERYLVVLHPDVVEEALAYVKRGGERDDGLVALLTDEALVVDRRSGALLSLLEANEVLKESKFSSLRRAALLRSPLPEQKVALTGEDLAWAFGLEVARRKLAGV
jgi:hypothetical protein